MSEVLASKKGFNGTIRVYEDYVEIDRSGHFAGWTAALIGKHSIHFSDIFSVGFKRRGILVGWIKVEPITRRAGYRNEDFMSIGNDYCVTFERHSQSWEDFYEYLREAVFEYKRKHVKPEQTEIFL